MLDTILISFIVKGNAFQWEQLTRTVNYLDNTRQMKIVDTMALQMIVNRLN